MSGAQDCALEESVSLQDVLEEDQELESTANAVLGDSDDSKCSYSKVWYDSHAGH